MGRRQRCIRSRITTWRRTACMCSTKTDTFIGSATTRIERVDNGTDGVLFVRNPNYEPFEIRHADREGQGRRRNPARLHSTARGGAVAE